VLTPCSSSRRPSSFASYSWTASTSSKLLRGHLRGSSTQASRGSCPCSSTRSWPGARTSPPIYLRGYAIARSRRDQPHGHRFQAQGPAGRHHREVHVEARRRRHSHLARTPVSTRPKSEESAKTRRQTSPGLVDDAVDCPVEIPAWLMGLCGFLGDLPYWMPRGAVIGGSPQPIVMVKTKDDEKIRCYFI